MIKHRDSTAMHRNEGYRHFNRVVHEWIFLNNRALQNVMPNSSR